MSYKLQKPYTDKEKADFIVEYNHKKGLSIQETELVLYALETNEIMQNGVPVINPDYEQEQSEKESERISMLFLTSADVERGLYKALGKDFDDIIEALSSGEGLDEGQQIDIKALKIELKANNFYRGNPYVSQMGALLGLTEKQLDDFFETGDYKTLISQEG